MIAAALVYYVYLLECAGGSLYCGYTDDLERRMALHRAGKGAKYTRSRLPVKLVYQEVFESATEARKREAQLKQCTRQQKLALISNQ